LLHKASRATPSCMSDDVLAILTGTIAIAMVAVSAWIRGRSDEREERRLAELARARESVPDFGSDTPGDARPSSV
jgi:hypothetical protein